MANRKTPRAVRLAEEKAFGRNKAHRPVALIAEAVGAGESLKGAKPPSGLGRAGAELWKRMVREARQLSAVDRPLLTELCMGADRLARIRKAMADMRTAENPTGELIAEVTETEKSRRVKWKQNPLVTSLGAAERSFLALASSLAITVKNRSLAADAIQTEQGKVKDEMSDAMLIAWFHRGAPRKEMPDMSKDEYEAMKDRAAVLAYD